MSLPGKMPFQFSEIMEMTLDNDAPKKVRDMGDRQSSKKAKRPLDMLIDFFAEEAFGKATTNAVKDALDRQKQNDARKKAGKKPINF
jgi:hypothetical protein